MVVDVDDDGGGDEFESVAHVVDEIEWRTMERTDAKLAHQQHFRDETKTTKRRKRRLQEAPRYDCEW